MFTDPLFRLRSLFRPNTVELEMDEELRFHLERQLEKLVRSGLSREEAMRRARLEFGGLDEVKENCRDARGVLFIESVLRDLRYGARQLRKSKSFAATAVLALALGIGVNACVFSMLNALVVRPLKLPHSEALYTIERGNSPQQSYPDYLDLRDRSHSFAGLAAYGIAPAGLDADGHASRIWLYEVSTNYFDVLDTQPYLGRFFHGFDEHGPNSCPYAVLNYDFWLNRFHGDPQVIGRKVRLNKHPFTVIAVAPPQFRGTEIFYSPDIWVPILNQQQIEGYSNLQARTARGIWFVGRLKPRVSSAELKADLHAVASSLQRDYPKEDDGIWLTAAKPGLIGDMLGRPVRAFVSTLAILAALILLAACANLGTLFASRTADRAREIAVCLALGSTRRRIFQQLLAEAVVVTFVGAALGLLGCAVLLRCISAWRPLPDFPVNVPVSPDFRTYSIALLLALLSAFVLGTIPVRQVLAADAYQVIKASAATRFGRFTVRDVMLAVQIAVCALLISASLVAVRGLLRALNGAFGFGPQNVTLVKTDIWMAGYDREQSSDMQHRMLDSVQVMPGTINTAYADRIPLALESGSSVVFADTTTDFRMSNAVVEAMMYRISPRYFSTARTTLIAGREFQWEDRKNRPRIAVVNRQFARKVFGSTAQALGSYFKVWGERVQVVGIAEDGKYRTLTEAPRPAVFLSFLQFPTSQTYLLVRSHREPGELAAALEKTLHSLDPGLPLSIHTWNRELDTALFAARAATVALGILGLIGAVLAITGVFGMAAYSVSKRLRELGIRAALGAGRKQLLNAALGRAVRVLALGSLVGLLLGLAASRLLSRIVYQATPRDPLVLAAVLIAMLLIGLLATWIPAQRALSSNPLLLLREE
jgi:macrolide transport system ATP-binding/permease protein